MQIATHHKTKLTEMALRANAISAEQFTICRRLVEASAKHWDFNAPANALDQFIRDLGLTPNIDLRRALVAKAMLELPDMVRLMRLPAEVTGLYGRMYDMVLPSLCEHRSYYDLDYYGKDVRLAFGLTVPAGAQLVDLYSRIGPKVIGRQLRKSGGLKILSRYVRSRGYLPWLQIHTDIRDTADFNEAGWDNCYRNIAALLRRDPDMRGMIGNSWFYDPVLPNISPRLAYLQKPINYGAFCVWTGSTLLDSERAGAKSPTRKALIEAGAYRPAAYTLVWPRVALLSWEKAAA